MIYKLIVDKQPMTNPSAEKKEYEFDIDQLYYKHDVYDAIVITLDEDYVIRRLRLGENNVLFIRDTPLIEPLPDLNIELFEGDNYIYVYDNTGTTLYAEYLIKNEFNELYVVYSEMNSAITQSKNEIRLEVASTYETVEHATEQYSRIDQTAQEISLEVAQKVDDSDYTHAEIVARINDNTSQALIDADQVDISANDVLNILSGNTINMTSKNIAINSTNFSVDKNGNMTCSNANVTGGSINLTTNTEDPTSVSNAVLSVKYSSTKYGLYSSGGFYIRKGSQYFYIQGNYFYIQDSSGNQTVIGADQMSVNSGNVYGQHTLYNNSSGTTGSVSLSDDASDYQYIEIFFKDNTNSRYGSQKIYSPDGKSFWLGYREFPTSAGTSYAFGRSFTISGTSLTANNDYGYIGSDSTSSTHTNRIQITKVIGYK